MDYCYENLGPERFQFLSQSLIAKEFPNVQCFPVAQRDGGRDAVSFVLNRNATEFIVFQVKFVRKPLAEVNPHNWLIEILKEEAPKTKLLIKKGAKAFYLITNVPGTAHLDAGAIDRMNKFLNEEIGIPSMCWWRDDLNRRLDNAQELKWVYPELMTGADMLHAIIENGLLEHKERRTTSIKAFLRDQYDIDREVRFKQVELQNRLLDLFVDVPILIEQNQLQRKQYYLLNHVAHDISHQTDEIDLDDPFVDTMDTNTYSLKNSLGFHQETIIGSATLLLNPITQKQSPKIVLEGAPGQGKSTIVQYLCQIHRMRILNKASDLGDIPDNHASSPIRLPFKVDLRDLATWLGKRDPFSSKDVDAPPLHWHKSLEAFLAAQVRHHSGGTGFDVNDLLSVMKLSSVLIVFDGLDEVADIARRQEVVDEIVKGVNRLEETVLSLQVIVTSRPAAFANSPGLPSNSFPYYQLASLTPNLIEQYANKWIRARRLAGREGNEVKGILKTKLDQPHLRDLARNPMQLAILLSLIHTRGSSLPDKRTALYDSYVELFFSRESEKSSVVREHRDLLIDIHGYLAWTLHSEAEQGGNSGSISSERLQRLLYEYLNTEGHDVELSKVLFAGMVERVVALVSRVQGTFEFEVQPLREYFAARYLYVTAPYSPVGNERRGTKPDRFDAIARDFYWLNVTRFYAGCFDKGELPSLVDRLQELITEDGFKNTSHPRILAATLLSDWVFSQHPKSVREVIMLILDGLGLRFLLNSSNRRFGQGSPLILPPKCGNEELISHCFSILQTKPPWDFVYDIIGLIKANSSPEKAMNFWMQNALTDTEDRLRWLNIGLHLELLPQITLGQIQNLMEDAPVAVQRLSVLLRSRRFDYCSSSEEIFNATLAGILDGHIVGSRQRRPDSVLDLICHVMDPVRYSFAFGMRHPISLQEDWSRSYSEVFEKLATDQIRGVPIYSKSRQCLELAEVAITQANRATEEWASDLTPWDNLVEKSRSLWGDAWATYQLANVAAGIKSSKATCVDTPDLFDKSKSLCRRARYARLRSGLGHWWRKQSETITNSSERMFLSLLLLSWASPITLQSNTGLLDELLEALSEKEWHLLISSIKKCMPTTNHGNTNSGLIKFNFNQLPAKLTSRTAVALALRGKQEQTGTFYQKYLSKYDGSEHTILEFCQKEALDLNNIMSPTWNPNLDIISRSYLKGIIFAPYAFQQMVRHPHMDKFPIEVAEQIVSHANKYPGHLVAFAESICRQVVASKIIPVGEIAERDQWFS